jgi:hypothetical protein
MDERFAELLAKGRTGQLTPGETEELARLLNAPILDSLESPAPGFVSKRDFTPGDLATTLRAIDWFAHCGEPISLDLSMTVEQVSSWPEAVESCADVVWENVELEARNQLTIWLHRHDRENYQNWNTLVAEHKAGVLDRLTDEKWIPCQQSRGLDIAVVHSVQWDVLGALMENSYLGSGHRCFFFLELLSVYGAGHFPCGWRGDWPQGALVAY